MLASTLFTINSLHLDGIMANHSFRWHLAPMSNPTSNREKTKLIHSDFPLTLFFTALQFRMDSLASQFINRPIGK